MVKKDKEIKSKAWNNKKFAWLSLAIILLITLIAYSNTFKVPFQFDDEKMIVKNQNIRSMEMFGKASTWLNVNKRPLSFITFAMQYSPGEERVVPYHIVNFIIHILAAFFVYLLARVLFRIVSKDPGKNLAAIHWKALFVALIFALHPLQTMGTTYIIQRMTSMAAMFYLLSVFLYTIGRLAIVKEDNNKKGIYLLILAGLSGILALLSKQNAITFPAAFLFVELFFIRNNEGKMYAKYIISGFGILILAFLTLLFIGELPREITEFTRWEYLLTQFKVSLNYYRLLFLPYGQDVDHVVLLSESIGFLEVLGMIIYAALVSAAILLYKRYKLVSFGIVWILLNMIVESSIIPIRDFMMEHRLYLPMFGFSLIIVSALYYIMENRYKKYISASLIVILLILTVLTYGRNKTWSSWTKLWENSVSHNPDNVRALTNLGYGYVQDDNYKEALLTYNKAIKEDSAFYPAYLNRGIALFDLQKYKLAIRDLSVYINYDKKSDIPFFFRGVSYGHLGRYPEAINDLSMAIEINPDFAGSYKNRGIIFELTENYIEALKDYNRALKLDPDDKLLLVNRSKANFMHRYYKRALNDAEEAMEHGIQIDPNFVNELKRRLADPNRDTVIWRVKDANGQQIRFNEKED